MELAQSYDPILYSEQMDSMLSEAAKTCKLVVPPSNRKVDRQKFLKAMDEAFEQIGGVTRFTLWADKNEDKFYEMYKRTIPQATLLDVMGKVQHQILPALAPSALDEAEEAEFVASD